MPELIERLDRIAWERGGKALFVRFGEDFWLELPRHLKRERTKLISFLEANGIGWADCAPPAGSGWISLPPSGPLLHVDVPYDRKDPNYQLVAEHLEDAEGRPRIKGVFFKLYLIRVH